MPKPYPLLVRETQRPKKEDANPAIQLFGRRFFSDQTIPEFLIEFLLVITSPKKIDDNILDDENSFPDMNTLRCWPGDQPLAYAPKSRLNLKLFALIGASKLETRHQIHRDHYNDLVKLIGEKTEASGGITLQDVLKTLENLFLGFQRVGGQRTWCAQSFLPICSQMIAGETIWKGTKAKKDNVETWQEITEKKGYLQSNQQIFLARGGEVLYLQICNALRASQEDIQTWVERLNGNQAREEDEFIPEKLRESLSAEIHRALNDCPSGLGLLAKFIDQGVDQETRRGTDLESNGEPRYTKCGWCPEETWKEGYLFAVDLLRICRAGLDPVERLSLMETACAVQVLRTLCAQSDRYDKSFVNGGAGPLGYVWAVSDPDGRNNVLKLISRRSVETNLLRIQRAVRYPEIMDNVAAQKRYALEKGDKWTDPYKEADTRYGYKLFLTLTKRLGFMVPRRGPGARFVLTDHLLRYLVLTIVRPGARMTYESFLEQVFLRFGMALGGKYLKQACEWTGTDPPAALNGDADQWLVDMLEGAGVLVRLSDSCSMVENPLGNGRS
ncbi:MAG: hypothetical protein RBR67_13500 [Desulfobacterium sp.]|nr:hypothetical protein [Desulfobacterium sp.]